MGTDNLPTDEGDATTKGRKYQDALLAESHDRIIAAAAGTLGRYLQRRVGSPEDFNDLVQEVYVRLLKASRSHLITNPAAYVYAVARQVLADSRRARSRRTVMVYDSQVAGDADADLLKAEDASPLDSQRESDSDVEAGVETQDLVTKAFARLDPMDRSVFLLRIEGFSVRESADKLGLREDQVLRRLAKARAELARLMVTDAEASAP